jgi:hypothetical protein
MTSKPLFRLFAAAFVLAIIASLFISPLTRVQGQSFTVEVWRPVEITLTSTVTYGNPYKDVEVSATFNGPGGTVMVMPGYWDGGATWRIRFAPTKTGSWTYSTTSTDGSNSGLNNKTGNITVNSYTGSLPIYQRGFLKISSNNRYMTYNDGTPFYWLGDTSWGGLNNATRLNESNDPCCTSMFKGIIDRRVQQGYTVWKAETFANNNESGNFPENEGGAAWNNGFFNQLNPGFWQNIDQRLQYVANSGMVISLAQGIGRSMTNSSGETEHKRLARYLLARYGAYPTVWITAQEYDDFGACGACWANVASYVYSLDPYKRPNSMHNGPSNPINYHDQDWYNFVTLQQAHGRADPVEKWLTQYNATPARPILEDEANYEDIIPIYATVQKWQVRQSAWMSQIGGGFGFTYGGQGIWYGCYTANDPNFNCGNGDGSVGRAWFQTLDFEVGGFQMTYMKNFFTSIEWWTLAPNGSAITWSGAPTNSQKPYQKVSADRKYSVAYLPQHSSTYSGTMNGLTSSRTYRARWFNPRSGAYTTISTNITGSTTWAIPNQPDTNDWVLLVDDVTGTPIPTPTPTATPDPNNISLVTNISSFGTIRNNTGVFIGMKLTVGSNPITVKQLGRYFLTGNNQSHTLKIVRVSDGQDVASVSVNMSAGSPDSLGYKYGVLATPVTLNANTAYYLVSQETIGGDSWYDNLGTTLSTTSAATVSATVYQNGSSWVENGAAGLGYGPLNLKYSVGAQPTFQPPTNTPAASTSFATGVNANGTLRNNSTAFIGMRITVGGSAISVTQLGRYMVAGNSGTHTLKIIRASDGAELGSASVNMGTGTADSLGFKYATLSSPVTLAANTAYYIVSGETAGGDQWRDNINTTLTTTTAATLNGSVYQDGSSWAQNGVAGESYVPLNFKYN